MLPNVEGADGTELRALGLLDSGGVIYELFNVTMLLPLTKDCWGKLTKVWGERASPAAPFPTGENDRAAMPTTTTPATMEVTPAILIRR